MALNNNTILKEFFADLAGTDATGKSFNTCLRLGLESSHAGLVGDFAGESPNWSDQLQSFAQEGRTYLEFDNP